MGITILYLLQGASPHSISTFSDQISNQTPLNTTKYGFEIKLYKDKSAPLATTNSSSFLHTLTSSVPIHPTTTTNAANSSSNNNSNGIILGTAGPGEMVVLVNNKTTLVAGQFESILSTKLQGMWQLRQTIRGDGSMFEFDTGGDNVGKDTLDPLIAAYNVKLANMMLQGNFKGLVVEVDLTLPEEARTPSNNNNNNKNNNNNDDSSSIGTAPTTTVSTGLTVEELTECTRKILTEAGLLKPPAGSTVAAAGAAIAAGVSEFNPKNIILGPKLKAAAAAKMAVTEFSRLDTVRQYIELIS